MAKGESLGVALPPQTRPGKESFDIRSGPLAKWLRELPVGNTGETTKQLYQALLDVNRHSHSWQRRYRFLEAIREPLDGVQRSLERRYSGLGFPLPAKSQQIATLSLRFHTEMAHGYLAAIEGMLASLFLLQDRRALKVMVHRATRYLNLSLLVSYQTYSQQPAAIWHQLHRLYSFAEARGFHQDPISDALFEALPESSIARIYKQIALLATTSPFRLRQGEAATIHQALARWSAHAKLLHPTENGAKTALFAIHLDGDEEPNYRAMDNCPCDTNCRLIDTHQMVLLLKEETGFAGGAAGKLAPELWCNLLQGWESPPKRSEHRSQGGIDIELVVGMNQIHALLAPTLQTGALRDTRANFEARPLHSGERRDNGNDIWNIHAAPGGNNRPGGSAQRQTPAAPQLAEAKVLHWQARDISSGGLRIAQADGQVCGMRVGELLALRSEQQNHWQLGQVRWLRRTGEDGLECGVQLLAAQVVAVMVTHHAPGRAPGESQRGLLLPEDAELAQPATLLASPRLFAQADKVLLHTPDNKFEAVLDGAIQENGTFVQFRFHAGTEPVAYSPDTLGGDAQANENVWEIL
ncbi:MAG TPA: hypothetical protein VGE00_03430 [Gammaproteobacteria bacterium]